MTENTEGEEIKIIDLIPPFCEGEPVEVIKVAGRRWRVLRHAVETGPGEYVSAWIFEGRKNTNQYPWRCSRCGGEVEDHYSIWTPLPDVLCAACREAGGRVPRSCAYCWQPLVNLLPIVVAGELRMVRVCPLHHVFAVTSWEE